MGAFSQWVHEGQTVKLCVHCKVIVTKEYAEALRDRDTRLAALESENTGLRELLARTYRAAIKPAWEEGECLNEVLSDVHWQGIAVPEIQKEQARPAEKGGEHE